MSTSVVQHAQALARAVRFDAHRMHIVLLDGREISVPLEWCPTLRASSPRQRSHWRLIGQGVGIH